MAGIEVMIDGEWLDRAAMDRRMAPNIENKLPLNIGTRVHWKDVYQSADYDATVLGKKYLFGAGYMYVIKVDNYERGWDSIWSCDITSDKKDLQYVYANALTVIDEKP